MSPDRRIALVTGANKGLGYETARRLGLLGMTVLVAGRDADRVGAAVERLAEGGADARPLILDVTDPMAIARAAQLVEAAYGRLDVLVNNAGIFRDDGYPAKVSTGRLRETFETNFFGPVAMIQAMAPLLRRSDAGRVVNLSSGLGSLTQHADPAYEFAAIKPLAYATSKAALNMATIQFAWDFRDSSVKVNAADPGYTATDFNAHRGHRKVEDGAEIIVRLATLPADGPSGGYFDETGAVPW